MHTRQLSAGGIDSVYLIGILVTGIVMPTRAPAMAMKYEFSDNTTYMQDWQKGEHDGFFLFLVAQ